MESINTHQSNRQYAQAVMLSEDEYSSYLPQFKNKKVALIGYGVTGKSAAEFLLSIGARVDIFDQQLTLSSVNEFAQRFDSNVSFYQFNETINFNCYDYLLVSPGVNLQQSNIKDFKNEKPDKIIGDIELFCLTYNGINRNRELSGKTPTKLVVVTGSNGKSTVVDMLFKALIEAGVNAALGGNFGTPALCLLNEPYDLLVLELSSFQLESTYSLKADIACVLNVTEDHMDRHVNLSEYATIKRSIYNNATHFVVNRDDVLTYPQTDDLKPESLIELSCFSNSERSENSSTVNEPIHFDGETIFYNKCSFLSKHDILKHNKFANTGNFQMFNMQVVLACAHILNVDINIIQKSLIEYTGLRHRFEVIQKIEAPFTGFKQAQALYNNNVRSLTWINDSKATNIGACTAAIENLTLNKKSSASLAIHLIAGGDAKGASSNSPDFKNLSNKIKDQVFRLTVMGKDAELFANLKDNCQIVNSMNEAVRVSFQSFVETQFSSPTDAVVLLSPGCASIDMFDNYQHRGDVFVENVKLVGE